MKIKIISGIIIFTTTIITFATAARPIVFVKNHKSLSVIVISTTASLQIKNIASLLQTYIKKSTGADLPIISTNRNTDIAINIGMTPLVKTIHMDKVNLDSDGFILQKIN